jgi:hypothetical protein
MQNGKTMLNLTKFRQNLHPVWAKMMANLFRRGISVIFFFGNSQSQNAFLQIMGEGEISKSYRRLSDLLIQCLISRVTM